MSFLSPVFLLGLPLVAVPLLIHFFNRKQRDAIRWGAMEFLMASAIRRRRFMRWRDYLLLLLRTALILAIIGALAQPMISSTWLGATGPRDVVIILDNSMSTARQSGGATVFARELDEASRLMAQLKSTDTLRVLLASPSPEWLADAPVAGGGGALHELAARVKRLRPNDGSADILECVEAALQSEPSNKDVSRFIAIITDGQAHGWHADTPGAWQAIHALAAKSPAPVSISVVEPEGISEKPVNLCVESLAAVRPVVSIGQPATLTASVKNTGTVATKATSLSWSARQESLGVSAVPALRPGERTTVNLSQGFANAGLLDISCHLAAQDDLAPDNSAHFLLEVSQSIPVLLVEGEPAGDPEQSDTRFFTAALGYGEDMKATPSGSVFRVKLINYDHLRAEELSAYQCIVLSDVPRVPADVAEKLARYVNSGGGLWIALGEQTDVSAFNQSFFEKTAGLSGMPLLQPTGDADDHDHFIRLTPPSPEHPATALLADTRRLDIDRVRIYRRHRFDAEAGGSSVSVLLRAEGGEPVAVERDLGRGRIIILSVPFGPGWSNFPLCHSYVVMAREWLWYLTEPGLIKRNLQAGETLQAVAPLESTGGAATLETPSGQTVQLFGQDEEGRLVFRYSKTQTPGEYRLALSEGKGSRSEKFLVGRDPEESNLTPLAPEQRKALSGIADVNFGGDPLFQTATRQHTAPPKSMTAWLLLAAIALMAVEIALAFWLGRRRRAPAPPIGLEPSLRA